MTIYTKYQIIPNGREKCQHFLFQGPPKYTHPNQNFWYENIPSGNPACDLIFCTYVHPLWSVMLDLMLLLMHLNVWHSAYICSEMSNRNDLYELKCT
jgi:hypothetical protein